MAINSKQYIDEAPDVLYYRGMERMVTAVQELSLARNLDTVMTIVRSVARELTGADGATFILREGNLCHYADEDAIHPLWKGRRFPMETCISGWVMLHREAVIIEDIYCDSRIPHDAYQPTFVKSLAMVPIRTVDPVGAIGNYWGRQYKALPQEVKLLQALADTTSVAMENVRIYTELEQRVSDRTAQLQQALNEIKTLQGLIPICASCKKIRDDTGYWQHLETYLLEYTEAEFTHGICPNCAEKIYGEYLKPE